MIKLKEKFTGKKVYFSVNVVDFLLFCCKKYLQGLHNWRIESMALKKGQGSVAVC